MSGTCVAVAVPVENNFWDTDKLSLGLAFLIGLIVGALICLLCAKLCLKDVYKSTGIPYQDLEAQYVRETKAAKLKDDEDNGAKQNKKKGKKKKAMKRSKKKGKAGESDEDVPVVVITLDKGSGASGGDMDEHFGGLADALMKRNSAGMWMELTNQDVAAINDLDRDTNHERINTMIQMLQVILRKQMLQGKLSDAEYKDLVKDMQDSVQGVMDTVQQEKIQEQQELERKYSKDPNKLEDELDKLHPKYINKMNSLITEEKERLRKDLLKNPQLNEDDVDLMLTEYSHNMAEMEKNMEEERKRQAQNLEERLARRRQMAEMVAMERKDGDKMTEGRVVAYEETLGTLVESGNMIERQKDELLDEYANSVDIINRKYEENLQTHQLKLAEKLKQKREERLKKLEEDQEEYREEVMANSVSPNVNPAEIYQKVLDKQRNEKLELMEKIDEDEAKEFNKINKEAIEEKEEELNKIDEDMEEKLRSRAQLSDADLNRLMKTHKQQVDQLNRQREDDKFRAHQKLQEKLEKRRIKTEGEAIQREQEKEALKQNQENTMKKVLDSQLELSNEAKDQIMQEHEQQMAKVNNQLEMSKLRQQKRLEAKLAARKARLAELKQKKDNVKRSRDKDKEKLMEKLDKEIEDEEKRLEEQHKADIQALRQRISEETTILLKQQEDEMGVLIARLQVGTARRQAVIARQEKELQHLQDKMSNKAAEKVEDGEVSHGNKQLDDLILQHQAQVENLQDSADSNKERQSRLLQEKLERKRLKKTREVEENLETDAQKEWENKQSRGAGLATSLLSQMMLDQKHQMAMRQLERDMEVELQKQTNILNQEMEEELLKELADQKKKFLATLAAVSNMSKSDINEVVESSVLDEKQAKKLAKELRIGMKNAAAEDDNDDCGYQGSRPSTSRAKSAKLRRASQFN